MNEVRKIRRTVRPPRGHFPGEIIEGHYCIVDNAVVMTDEDGKPTGEKHRLDPGDDPHIVAYRLLRQRRRGPGPRGWNDKLIYPRMGKI